MAKLLTKGTLVELTGRVSPRAWVSKEGEPKAGLNLHTSQIKLYGGNKRAETTQATALLESSGGNRRRLTILKGTINHF